MPLLKLFLFGAPQVERDNRPVPIRRRKGMALLAYLAFDGQTHGREALATLLWPEFEQSSALSNLRREISRLKRDTGVNLFLADRKHLAIGPEAELWLDARRFRELLAIVEDHNHFPAQHCDACLEALHEATTLATDDFMAGFTLPDAPEFDEWHFFQREGLNRSLSAAQQKLIEWHSNQAEYGTAVTYARHWLALDPLHEPAHRALMMLYAREGRQAAALRQYEECVRLLHEELGVEPEPATCELYEAIRTRRFASSPAPAILTGDEALAQGKPLQAQTWFQERLQQSQESNDDRGMVRAWLGLGRASLGLDHEEMARHHFLGALQRTQVTGDQDLAFLVLANLVDFFMRSGDPVRAVELAMLVANHPSVNQENREQVAPLLAEEKILPADRLAEAQKHAARREIWPTIAELAEVLSAGSERAPGINQPRLPTPPTPFIGRKQEMADIRRLLLDEPDCRLLTVIGPAGIGKTRLALEAAAQGKAIFPGGVFFISLAPISSVGDVVFAIADGLGFQFIEPAAPMRQLLAFMSQKTMLLVLDNFEHVLEGATVVAEILQSAPAVSIIATSREALNITGETVYPVQGLSIPMEGTVRPADVSGYDALELLLRQARRVRPGFEPGEDDLHHAVRIVRLVWGMPLALVMAAGWLEVLSLAEIADEIAENLGFLESTARDLPERQRSMRAAFDHSWQRLPAAEQQAFMKLSIFRGGFNRQAAEAVAKAGLRTLRTLVNKSFLTAHDHGRFDLHELLRQHGLEQLRDAGEMHRIQATHSQYYLHAIQQREADIKGRRQLGALEEIEADLKNVRAAWQWAVETECEELLNNSYWSLHLAFHVTGRYYEGVRLFRPVWIRFAPPEDAPARKIWKSLVPCLAYSAAYSGTATPEMKRDVERCLDWAKAEGEPFQEANSLLALSCYALFVEQDPCVAIPFLQRCLELYRMLDEQFSVALTLAWLGWAHGQNGEPELFRQFCEQSLAIAQETGNRVVASAAKHNLGFATITAGDYVAAEQYCRQALEIATEVGRLQSLALAQLHLALIHFLRGEFEQAKGWASQGQEIGERINVDVTKSYAYSVLSLLASMDGDGVTACRMSEKSRLPTAAYYYRILSNWARALSHAVMNENAIAWEVLAAACQQVQEAKLTVVITWLLPVAAILLERTGQRGRATELLALAHHHPKSPLGWMQRWSLLEALAGRLRQELGEEDYQQAWIRGKQLDLEAAAHFLLQTTTSDTPA